MRYGYFDNASREYVIDRVDVPASWTNYIGLKDFYGVFNHTAAGYVLYKSPEYHRITRFRPNGPVDGPGHYVYLRDNDTGDFWSVSWQPGGQAQGALFLPPRPELQQVPLRLLRHQCPADPVCGH